MDTKEIEALDSFGKIFTAKSRDDAYEYLLKVIDGRLKSKEDIELSEEINHLNSNQIEILKKTVLSVLDVSLHHFLWMIEQSDGFDLVAIIEGKSLSLKEISDGLCGEPHGENGWFAKYSKYQSTLI